MCSANYSSPANYTRKEHPSPELSPRSVCKDDHRNCCSTIHVRRHPGYLFLVSHFSDRGGRYSDSREDDYNGQLAGEYTTCKLDPSSTFPAGSNRILSYYSPQRHICKHNFLPRKHLSKILLCIKQQSSPQTLDAHIPIQTYTAVSR